MSTHLPRRRWLQSAGSLVAAAGTQAYMPSRLGAASYEPSWEKSIERGLRWVANTQSRLGHWTAGKLSDGHDRLGGNRIAQLWLDHDAGTVRQVCPPYRGLLDKQISQEWLDRKPSA